MPKLFAGNYKKIDDHTVEITVQKTQEQAVIYPFPVAKEILNKYRFFVKFGGTSSIVNK